MTPDPDPTIEILQATVSLQRQILAAENVERQYEHALDTLLRVTSSPHGFLCESVGEPLELKVQAIAMAGEHVTTVQGMSLVWPILEEQISQLLACQTIGGAAALAGTLEPLERILPSGHSAISAFVGIPLHAHGELVGMIGLVNRPGGYDQSLVDQLAPLRDACTAMVVARRQSVELARRQEQSLRAEQALRNLAQSATPIVGEEFFHTLVRTLASSLEVDYAFVSRLDEENPLRVRTIAAFGNGARLDNLAYQLPHTPCHDVVRSGPLFLPSGAQMAYPLDHWLSEIGIEGYIGIPLIDTAGRVLGLVSALSKQPLRRPDSAVHQMMVWAARATAELARLAAVEELQVSRQRFQALVEHGSDATNIFDANGVLVYSSPNNRHMLGYEPEEVLGRNGAELLRTDAMAAARKAWQTVLATPRQPVRITIPIRHKSGEWRWAEVCARNLLDDPNVKGIVTNWHDVTERHRAEEAVRSSEERFRQLFEHSPDAIFVEDLQGNVLDVNPAACRLHDRERGDLVGRNIEDLVPPPLRKQARRDFARLVAGEVDQVDGYSWVRTGHALPVAIRASRIEYFGQQAILLHVRDVSAQRAAEDALRASEARFRMVLEQLPSIVWTVDTQQRITLALGRPMASLGRTAENTVGLTIAEYFRGRIDADRLLEYHRRALAGESIHYETQVCGIAFECRLQPLRNPLGEIVGCLGASLDVTERVRATAAVRESESRFRAIFDSSPECVKLLDRDGTLLEINQAGLDMIEAEFAGQVVGHCVYPTVMEEYRADFQRLIEQVFDGHPGMLEFEIVGLKGGRLWLETHGTPLLDSAGGVVAALSVTRDVTEGKRAQQELLQRNLELEAIFQAYPDLYFVVSEAGTIEQYRAGKSGDLYVPPDQFLGRRMQDVLPSEIAARFDDVFARLAGGGRLETVEYELQMAGQQRQFEARVASLDGRRIAVLVRNITDRRQLEQAIRESEERFRQFADHLPFMVCMLSPDMQQMLYVNRAAETIFARNRDSLKPSPANWLTLIHDEDRQRIAERMAEPFDGTPRTAEFRVLRPDGTVRWLRSLAVPLINGQGAFYLLTVLVEDVTDQKLAAERLAHKQAELLHVSRLSTIGQMVATMSHEISQPLAALGNYSAACASLLNELPAPQPEQFRHYVGEISRQTQRAGAILRRLRAFGARSSPDREPYHLNWLLHDAAELVASELRRQGIALHWELAEQSQQVLVDRIQFQQVIVNLLTNACDALQGLEPHCRKMAIRSLAEEGAAVIEIIDSGPGLPNDVLPSLFEPFFTTKPDGMGLGLSICREIIEDHGGQIEAENSPQGGAVFRVRLPLEEEQPTSPVLVRLPELQPE